MDVRSLVYPQRYRNHSSAFDQSFLREPGIYLIPDKWFANCLVNSVCASRELSLKHIFCPLNVQSRFGAMCVTSLYEIVWAVDELNKCKIFSLHFLKQIFHDWCCYYRIFQQFHFSVGITLKTRNSEKSYCLGLLVFEDFQKSPRMKMP